MMDAGTLIVSFYNVDTIGRGVMLDQLQQQIDKGLKNLYFLSCFQAFDVCGRNHLSNNVKCYICEANVRNNIKLVRGEFQQLKLRDIIFPDDEVEARAFFSLQHEITRDVWYENFEVGEAALSSYITVTRDKELSRLGETTFLERVAYNSLLVYLAIKRFIDVNRISTVIIFNGRFDYVRAVLRACGSAAVNCQVFERARPGGYYERFVNTLPHNILEKKSLIDEAWRASPLPIEERIKIGSEFFHKKVRGEVTISKSYTSGQVKDNLPKEIDFAKRTIVLYNSSDDEFVAVGKEYANPFFADQNAGIFYLVDLFGKAMLDYNLVIRMHPNLTGVRFRYSTDILALHKKFPNVFVIGPESTVDSYALLEKAWKVISFGSSIGMEATFWGKPVILLAKCRYFYSDVAHVPENVDSIATLLEQDLEPKPRLSAIVFGFYYMAGGEKAPYFESKTITDQVFKGRQMNRYSLKQRSVAMLMKAANSLFGLKIKGSWF